MKKGFTLVEIMIVVAIIGLLAAIAIPSFMRARLTSQQNACINNLRQIEAGKDQYALEQGFTNLALVGSSETIAFSNLISAGSSSSGYIKSYPLCPASTNQTRDLAGTVESYLCNAIGTNSTCRKVPLTHYLR